jgi:hypothetical protein
MNAHHTVFPHKVLILLKYMFENVKCQNNQQPCSEYVSWKESIIETSPIFSANKCNYLLAIVFGTYKMAIKCGKIKKLRVVSVLTCYVTNNIQSKTKWLWWKTEHAELMLHSHLQGHILLKTYKSFKWISPRESRWITLMWQQVGKKIYSCEVKSANKPKRSQCTQYHWHMGYLALQSRKSKGNISPLQVTD